MTIPQELQQFVDTEVASGKYRSSEELIFAALRLLQERERKLNSLRADLQTGIEQLDGGECTDIADEAGLDAFFDDVEYRGQQRRAQNKV